MQIIKSIKVKTKNTNTKNEKKIDKIKILMKIKHNNS